MTGGVLHALDVDFGDEPDLAAIRALLDSWGRAAAAFRTITPEAAAAERAVRRG